MDNKEFVDECQLLFTEKKATMNRNCNEKNTKYTDIMMLEGAECSILSQKLIVVSSVDP